MDQIKEQLVKIKPFAFWIACVVILLGSLATWYMATAKLNEERAANESKIKNAFSGLVTIQPKLAKHPNPGTNAEMTKLTLAYGEEVARGWELQYQKQEGVLVWPASFDQDFHDAVKDLRPIEKVPVDKVDYKLTLKDDFRRRYRDFIEDELPKLAETIGGKWYANRDASAEVGPGPTTGLGPDGRPTVEVDRSMVLWAPENQRELLATHFGFTARANDPSTLDVLYAQEDLWVLQNLMDIIKRTNEGAEGRHDAAVKQIEFVRIGRAALGQSGAVMMVGGGTGGPGESGFPTGPGGPGMEGMQPGMPAGPGAPAVAGETPAAGAPVNPTADVAFQPADPGNWRYVDKANTPLAGFQLRQAIAPTAPGAAPATPSPETVLLTVAKRMPVRIRLEIDQRRLNKLLTEFGNAQLPVEVRQLRINRTAAAAGNPDSFFGALGGGQGGGPGGGSMEGGYPIPGGMNQGGPNGPGNLTRDATVDTNLIKLELYGIVYLYNPVNRSVLGLPVAGPGATAMATPAGAVRGG
jgi:hypothetical protein